MNRIYAVVGLYIFSSTVIVHGWVHRFYLPVHAIATMQTELVTEKTNVDPFSQLLFSWNALRPGRGHLSFLVQVRNAQTKQWGIWHHAADWGKDIQKSYYSAGDSSSSYEHVRLELKSGVYADGFRIKVVGHNVPLFKIHALLATTCCEKNFKPEQVALNEKLTSVLIRGVVQCSQFALEHAEKDRLCSPTSWSMLLHHMTKKSVDPCVVATGVYDAGLDSYGSWPFNSAYAYEHAGGKYQIFHTRLASFGEMHELLKKGFPVIVSVRGSLKGAPRPYLHGHLLVVVGFNARTQEVICHDPAGESNQQVRIKYPLHEFVRAWELSRRLAYVPEIVSSSSHRYVHKKGEKHENA